MYSPMKKIKENLKDLVSIILLIGSFFLLINPFGLIMTDQFQMLMLALTSIIVITILIFLWKENPKDEREEAYLIVSSRISFFSVAIILLVALVVQALQHMIDLWIALSLITLVMSKILALAYLKSRK